MTDCFQTVIGLSDRDCDCFEAGRPDAPVNSTETRSDWDYLKDIAPESPGDPYTITTPYDLPENHDRHIQLFAGGQLQSNEVDFTVTGQKEITVSMPIPLQVYQLYYLANIPTSVSTPAYSESDSGLFITDLLPEEEIAALASCDQTLWDLMSKARSVAIKEFRAALNTTLARRYQAKYPTFSGNIGEAKASDYLSTGSAFAGIRIRTNGMRSGYLKISRILAMFEATGTVNVTIYDGLGTVAVPSFPISTVAGGKSYTSVDITLPLLGDFQHEQDYFLAYSYDGANRPRLNKTYCGCDRAFSPVTDVNTFTPEGYDPHFDTGRNQYRGRYAWHNFIMLGGWEGDSVADFSDAPDQVTEYMNGLCLEIEVGCDMAQGLCGMVQAFGSNQYAMSVATAIQRRSAAYLIARRLNSSQPNRANAVNREHLVKTVGQWEGEYAEIVQWLSQNLPATSLDCFECQPRVRRGAILG